MTSHRDLPTSILDVALEEKVELDPCPHHVSVLLPDFILRDTLTEAQWSDTKL